MGVKTCSRNNCGNIMCDTYLLDVGYMCNECKNEFKEYLNINYISLASQNKFHSLAADFLKTEKGVFEKGNEITVDEYLDKFTDKGF